MVPASRTVVQYFDAHGVEMPSAAGADHRRETIYLDSIAGTVNALYPSGKLRESAAYANLRTRTRNGPRIAYYEDGKIESQDAFVAGKREGERKMYYPDGTLRRHDVFANDVRISGEYFTANGSPAPYLEAEEFPRYHNGGLAEIVAAISQNVRYPFLAQLNNVQGRVFITFNVTEKGRVVEARVLKGIAPSLDNAALKAVNRLQRFAAPGKQEGEAVTVSFTVPVTFRLQ